MAIWLVFRPAKKEKGLMAIDPDVQPLITALADRLAALEGGDGSHTHPDSGGGAAPVDVGIRYVSKAGTGTDGLSWQSSYPTLMEAALNLSRGEIRVGRGDFYEAANIPWKQGVKFVGLGNATTDVRLEAAETGPLFVSDPALAGTDFLHWSGISGMKLRGNGNGGDLILFNCRVGEDTVIENVVLHPGAGADGIHTTRGGQPIFWNNIHSFTGPASGSGISLQRTGGDVFHGVILSNISGDNHGTALIRAQGFLNPKVESLTILGLKSESGNGQLDTVVLHGMDCPTLIVGAAVYDAGGSPNSLVKIFPSSFGGSYVTLENCVGGMTNWIDDEDLGIQVAKGDPGEGIVRLNYMNGDVTEKVTTR